MNDQKRKKDVDFSPYLPDDIIGIKVIDPNKFNVPACFSVIKCEKRSCTRIQAAFQHSIVNRKNFNRVISCEVYGKDNRLILLAPNVKSEEELSDAEKNILHAEKAQFLTHTITLTYDNFTLDEILQKVLPEDTVEIVSSFETVGHIAHVNLKEHLLEYKHLIGQVLLDKNPNIKTVVNKTNSISETFRFFNMELIAGEKNMFTTVQEHGSIFEFDYSKVYWNSRLQTEHQRIVKKLKPNDVVFDVFAGVGPFAIPAAKKKCKVFANDLNKEAVTALQHNAEINNVADNIKTFNLDGKEFLGDVVVPKLGSLPHDQTNHIVMNLPAIAPEFLSVFRDIFRDFTLPLNKCNNIFIHCYCFSKSKTPVVDAETIISEAVGIDISIDSETHFVRRVAPNKVMMCVTFQLFWFETNAAKCSCHSTMKRTLGDEIDLLGPNAKSKKIV